MVWLFLAFIVMFIFLAIGMWIAAAFGIAGFISLWPMMGDRFFFLVGEKSWALSQDFLIIAVPLFVLMGDLLFNTGMMDELYNGLIRLIPRWLKGGLIQVNVISCTIFAACSGLSVASAATIGRLAYPALTSRGYDNKLTLGSIACGGSLGILIPPSVVFIVYAMLVGESVAKLFVAGLIPGLLLACFFSVAIMFRIWINPELEPKEMEKPVSLRDRLFALGRVSPFFGLIVLVLGSIYLGIATPTEAASFGCGGALLIGLSYRRLTWGIVKRSLRSAVVTGAFIYFIVIAASLMKVALAYYHIEALMEDFLILFGRSRAFLFVAIVALYVVLGCVMDPLGMTLVTLPFVSPLLLAAGFDMLWFGVVFVILVEMAQITPPIGFILFVLQGVCDVPISEVSKSVLPFLPIYLFMIVLLYLFPKIALWLPSSL